jgi:hypothetical protein
LFTEDTIAEHTSPVQQVGLGATALTGGIGAFGGAAYLLLGSTTPVSWQLLFGAAGAAAVGYAGVHEGLLNLRKGVERSGLSFAAYVNGLTDQNLKAAILANIPQEERDAILAASNVRTCP